MTRQGKGTSKRLIALAAIFVVVLVWFAAGIRWLTPASEFGVLQGPAFLGLPRLVDGQIGIAPPGIVRLSRYPRDPFVLPLPQAEEAMIPSDDGSRYGFRGWATLRLRPEAWVEIAAADRGGGARDLLLDAVKNACAGMDRCLHRNLGAKAFRDEIRQRLTAELADRGADLRDLSVDSLDYLLAVEGQPYKALDTRLLVIGLDGADWVDTGPAP